MKSHSSRPYTQSYSSLITNNFMQTAQATESSTYLELNKGDMIHHAAFGKGMVLSVLKMGGDALLEIAFDEIGTKKLMAKTASTHMTRL